MRGSFPDLKRLLAGAVWPPVVLLCGEDSEARERGLAAVIAALPEEERGTAVERFAGAPVLRVLDAARTAPLLGGRRIVIASGIDWLEAGGDETAQQELLRFLAHAPEHALLILISPKADRRIKLMKSIEERGFVLDCPLPKEREMAGWIGARAQERGFELAPRAAQLLADAIGTDTGLAARELDKLALIAEHGEGRKPPTVDLALVEEALGPHRVPGAFALEDALLGGRGAEALEALDRHLDANDSGIPLALLGRMSAIVRRLSLAAEIVERGGGEQDVQETLGAHPFVAQKYTQAARRIGPRSERALAACVAADGMLKSGRDPRAALVRVVLALAAPSHASGRHP